jgi:hypothetical protein
VAIHTGLSHPPRSQIGSRRPTAAVIAPRHRRKSVDGQRRRRGIGDPNRSRVGGAPRGSGLFTEELRRTVPMVLFGDHSWDHTLCAMVKDRRVCARYPRSPTSQILPVICGNALTGG